MTDTDALADASLASLKLLLEIAAPVVLPVLGVALLVGLVQAATSISEATLSFVPKLIAAGVCLALFGALMARLLVDFTLELYDRIPGLLR